MAVKVSGPIWKLQQNKSRLCTFSPQGCERFRFNLKHKTDKITTVICSTTMVWPNLTCLELLTRYHRTSHSYGNFVSNGVKATSLIWSFNRENHACGRFHTQNVNATYFFYNMCYEPTTEIITAMRFSHLSCEEVRYNSKL